MKKDPNKYPKGWSRKRVEAVIAHFDRQTEAEAIAEADAAWENSHMSLVRVPVEFVDDVKRLVAERSAARRSQSRRGEGQPTMTLEQVERRYGLASSKRREKRTKTIRTRRRKTA